MKVLFINEMCGTTSTGRIVCELADQLEAEGHECKIAFGRADEVPEKWRHYAIRIGTDFDVKKHVLRTRLLDECGFGSKRSTANFLKWANDYNPDVLWLHNLHGYYINVEMLFAWIKSFPDLQVKWTLHDCWPFTGHCSSFSFVNCEQWKFNCEKCPQLYRYPKCFLLSNVSRNFVRKKAAFTGVKNMTLIVPSKWLKNLVNQSYLKEYPVEVHYNTVNDNTFKPTVGNFRERYGLKDKTIILSVANVWDERKGLYKFYDLAERLDDSYEIVLVGLSKKQMKTLPAKVTGIERTNDLKELATIYTAADVYVSLSVEETFGMTVLESKKCGTIPIVLKGTACEEVANMISGIAVDNNLELICSTIQTVCKRAANNNR